MKNGLSSPRLPRNPSGYVMKRRSSPTLRAIEAAERRGRVAPLCRSCRMDDHSSRHDPVMGCTAIVSDEPSDFICSCYEGVTT